VNVAAGAPHWRRAVSGGRVLAGAAALAATSFALAAPGGDDASAWLARAANAARQLNYIGTIVYQYGPRVETSRLVHMREGGNEFEKLVNLEGPAREVIRTGGDVYCFYPDAKVVRVEPRIFRNAFPSVSPQQQRSLSEFYQFKRAEPGRVAGIEADAFVFEPKDGLRYGHKFWADAATGLLLKARVLNERGDVVEQFAFTDIAIGVKIDRSMVRPSWPTPPPDWQVRHIGTGEVDAKDTGWVVTRLPAGFVKIAEGFRSLPARRPPVAHLVFSDGLVAVSVFVEPVGGTAHSTGLKQEGAVNMYIRQLEDYVVTVLGEAPPVTIRQIALAVARR
jgi:sigma-E factor negative regulatory protein RseB